MALAEDLDRIAAAARGFAGAGEELEAVIPAEPGRAARIYLCAYIEGEMCHWLVLDDAGRPVEDRARVRDAVSIAAMCELAEEAAGGGKLSDLRARLAELRAAENPEGIDEAEQAAADLERTIAAPPRLATPDYLDRVGGATRRLELALGEGGLSPFAETMKRVVATVEELKLDVETNYKGRLR